MSLLDGRRPALDYDHLVDRRRRRRPTGSASTGAAEHAFPLYALDDAVRLRNHVLEPVRARPTREPTLDRGRACSRSSSCGGGPTGVEVAGALAELVDKVLAGDFHDLDVRPVTDRAGRAGRPALLPPFSHRVASDARVCWPSGASRCACSDGGGRASSRPRRATHRRR